MWPFNKRSIQKQVEDLKDAVRTLTRDAVVLQDSHIELSERFKRLHGRVYAAGIHKNPLQQAAEDKIDAPVQAMTRDELRKKMGFVPGKPMQHKD